MTQAQSEIPLGISERVFGVDWESDADAVFDSLLDDVAGRNVAILEVDDANPDDAVIIAVWT